MTSRYHADGFIFSKRLEARYKYTYIESFCQCDLEGFSCFLCPGCVCQTGTRPCRFEELPCGAGWSPSLPVLWWTSPAPPGSVSRWNHTTERESHIQLELKHTYFISPSSHRKMTELSEFVLFSFACWNFSKQSRAGAMHKFSWHFLRWFYSIISVLQQSSKLRLSLITWIWKKLVLNIYKKTCQQKTPHCVYECQNKF